MSDPTAVLTVDGVTLRNPFSLTEAAPRRK